MSSNNQTTETVQLLFIGATDEVAAQCEPVISGIGIRYHHQITTTLTSLEMAFSKQRWDIILIFPPLETVDLSQIMASMATHNIDGTLLMCCEELAGDTAIRGMKGGVHNAVSLQHCEHFQLTLRREIELLKDRRLLHKLQRDLNTAATQGGTASQHKKDLLTGLYTQHFFTAGSQQAFKKSPPDDNTQHSIIFITLDKINMIREQVGIAAADIIIAEIASCIRRYIPASYPIARIDHHSFALLIQKTTLKKVQSAAQAIRKTVSDFIIDIAGSDISRVTCSIGFALTNDKTDTAQLIMRQAQMACEGASAAGGNQFRQFDPSSDEQYGLARELKEEQQWEGRIREALKENRFKLLYQPIVSLRSNTAENYELLLRMLDDNHEEILPGEFMPIAAQAGLMPAIDRWVTRNALTELSERRRSGKDTSFFIKLDHTTLSDGDFHTWLSERLRANKMPGDALVFEISERSDLKSPGEVAQFMQQLKVLRCRCALDHFGDNEASLERLRRLPIDFIKIDRGLIQRIKSDPTIQTKVKQLVTTAHDSSQKAIAEFVQDARTLSRLWSCDMDYIQGYFLQRPDGTMDYDFTEEN